MRVYKLLCSKYGACLATAVGICLASGTAILVKKSFASGADVMGIIALRMLFSMPFFVVVGYLHYKRNPELWKGISLRLYMQIGATGLLGYYLTSYTNFLGLQYISASLERIVMFVYPTFVLFLSAIVYRARVLLQEVIAIKITYIGLIISFASQLSADYNRDLMIGGALVLFSALLFAANITVSKNLVVNTGPIPVTVVSFLVASITVLFQFCMSYDCDRLLEYQPDVYFDSVLMAVLTTLLPAILMGFSLKYLSAIEVAVISCIGPPFSFFLSAIFLGETIVPVQILGSFVVIAGVLFLQFDGLKLLVYKVQNAPLYVSVKRKVVRPRQLK